MSPSLQSDPFLQIDLIWLILCTALVLLMQAGFLCVESGAVRRKNTVNVAIKNILDFCIAAFAFYLIGYSLAFGDSVSGIIGNPAALGQLSDPAEIVKFLYLLMFCGTAVTIISGAIAERTRLIGYLIITAMISIIIYPIFCHWVWNDNGWLAQLGFVDFAGASVVHATGGWLALAACLVIGPRAEIDVEHGAPAYNLTYSSLGALLLLLGWLGFNGGSLFQFGEQVISVLANTVMAGIAGGLVAALFAIFTTRILRFELLLIGMIAALVGVTASAHAVSINGALIVGSICAVCALIGHRKITSLGVDDVVGAFAAHGVAGVVGILLVPFVADANLLGTGLTLWPQLEAQLYGVIANFAWSFVVGGACLLVINLFVPLRCSIEAERQGLDLSEHGVRNALFTLGERIRNKGSETNVQAGLDPNSEEGQIALEFETLSHQVVEAKNDRSLAYESKHRADRANEAKSQFLANMSHELRTPLNGILGTLEVVLHDKLDDELKDSLYTAKSSSEHLLALLNDLLDTAKLEAGEVELEWRPVELKVIAREVTETFSHAAKQKGIRLKSTIETDVPDCVIVDSTRLKQVLMNLIGNALKFTEEGTVSLAISTFGPEDGLHNIRFEIADSGIGIPESAQATIFERFKQADNSTTRHFGGTGLGLALCKDLAELMGGSIELSSIEGQGSTFSVTLPLQIGSNEETESSPTAILTDTDFSQTKILVAEDNATNQIVVGKILDKLGFASVTIVENGKAALDAWKDGEFDLILMDCQMPVMDGLEATQKIRTLETSRGLGSIPIIATTANASMLDQQECLKAGMTDHLPKPLRINQLSQTLSRHLSQPSLKGAI